MRAQGSTSGLQKRFLNETCAQRHPEHEESGTNISCTCFHHMGTHIHCTLGHATFGTALLHRERGVPVSCMQVLSTIISSDLMEGYCLATSRNSCTTPSWVLVFELYQELGQQKHTSRISIVSAQVSVAVWDRQCREGWQQMDTGRGFLEAARRKIWGRAHLQESTIRQLHDVGLQSVLCVQNVTGRAHAAAACSQTLAHVIHTPCAI